MPETPDIHASAIEDATPPRTGDLAQDYKNSRYWKFRRAWIARLRTMPPYVFQELVDRLVRGDSAIQTTKWLAAHHHRGELRNVGYGTLKQYVLALNLVIRDRKQQRQQLDRRALNARILAERARNAEFNAIQHEVDGTVLPDTRKIEDIVGERMKAMDAKAVLAYALEITHERLERCRKLEETTHIPMDAGIELTKVLVDIAGELRKVDVADLYKLIKGGGPDGWAIPTGALPGNTQPKQLTEGQKETGEIVNELPQPDRILLRDGIESVMSLLKLQDTKPEVQEGAP